MRNSWIDALLDKPALCYISEDWKMSVPVLVHSKQEGITRIAAFQYKNDKYSWISDYPVQNISHWQYIEVPN